MIENSISLVMPIHNQEEILEMILNGIYDNISENVKECIYILDGCTDNSEVILHRYLNNNQEKCGRNCINAMLYAPDVYEVKACNVGFKLARCEYILNIQDDMKIEEKDFDKRLLKPFGIVSNLFAVTARDAVNLRVKDDTIEFYDVVGKDVGTQKGQLNLRKIVNRGPVLFKNSIMQELGYLDEDFYPLTQDDSAICLSALRKGYVVGSYMIDYRSDIRWGSTHKSGDFSRFADEACQRNFKKLIVKFPDMIALPDNNKTIIID